MPPSRVEAQFGTHAAAYASSPVHARGASLDRVLELVQPRPHWDVLDVATGAGHMAAALAPLVASVVAADLTPEMLREARTLAQARGLDNVKTVLADAGALPFVDESFDLVASRIAAHHFRDVTAFAREACRVARRGGRVALVDNVSPDRALFPEHAVAELAEAADAYNAFERLRDPSHERCLGFDEWRCVLRAAGLVVTHVEKLDKAMELRSWADRMGATPEAYARLEKMLRDSGGLVRDFLAPRDYGGSLSFTLHEGIFIAVRP
jgi:SAM-dependent methyltransferase